MPSQNPSRPRRQPQTGNPKRVAGSSRMSSGIKPPTPTEPDKKKPSLIGKLSRNPWWFAMIIAIVLVWPLVDSLTFQSGRPSAYVKGYAPCLRPIEECKALGQQSQDRFATWNSLAVTLLMLCVITVLLVQILRWYCGKRDQWATWLKKSDVFLCKIDKNNRLKKGVVDGFKWWYAGIGAGVAVVLIIIVNLTMA